VTVSGQIIEIIMADMQYLLRPIGLVESPLKSKDACPKQGSEDAPDAWLVIDPVFVDGSTNSSVNA
jgi:tRNA (Thr-GGU) A37 N-methylase